MSHNKSVNLAWQFPDTRDWHVVGHLTEKKDGYFFNYTNGAKSEGFIPFSGMEDIYKTYISEKLFPLFQNRLLSPKRNYRITLVQVISLLWEQLLLLPCYLLWVDYL